jgi:hypothetical protein
MVPTQNPANGKVSGICSVGYVGAWFVQCSDSGSLPGSPHTALPTLVVYPVVELNLREQATTNSPRLGDAQFNRPLTVLQHNFSVARVQVGQNKQ